MSDRVAAEKALAEVSPLWALQSSPIYLQKSESFVYECQSKQGPLIARVTHKSHRTQQQIQSELHWVNYLHAKKVPVVPALEGKSGVVASQGDFHIAVFPKASGKTRPEIEDLTDETFRNWGRIIGQMHLHTQSYQRPENITPRPVHYEDSAVIIAEGTVKNVTGRLAHEFHRAIHWLKNLPQDQDSFGLCHLDAHPGNFAVDGDEIHLFDFDDCSYYWFAGDIAIVSSVLGGWSYETKDPNLKEKKIGLFWEGYEEHHKMAPVWIDRVPAFQRARRSVWYFWAKGKLDRGEVGEELVPKVKEGLERTARELDEDFDYS